MVKGFHQLKFEFRRLDSSFMVLSVKLNKRFFLSFFHLMIIFFVLEKLYVFVRLLCPKKWISQNNQVGKIDIEFRPDCSTNKKGSISNIYYWCYKYIISACTFLTMLHSSIIMEYSIIAYILWNNTEIFVTDRKCLQILVFRDQNG